MAFSLRNKLKEITAQVNPFDGGKTAATVRQERQQAQPARLPMPGTPVQKVQTTNQPQQQIRIGGSPTARPGASVFSVPQVTQPKPTFANLTPKIASTPTVQAPKPVVQPTPAPQNGAQMLQQAGNQTVQAVAPVQKPSSFKLTDNSLTRGISSVPGIVNRNVVQPTIETGKKSFNTVRAGVNNAVGLADAGIQSVIGSDASYQNALNKATAASNASLNRGAFLTPQQAQSRGGGFKSLRDDFIKPTAQGVSEIAPLVVPFGATARGASTLSKILNGAGQNAAVGAATTATQQAVAGQMDAGDIAKSALVGGLVGGAVPVAGVAARAGGRVAANEARNFVRNPDERGSIGNLGRYDPENQPVPINEILAQKQAELANNPPVPNQPVAPATLPDRLKPQSKVLPVPNDVPTTNAGPVKRTRFTDKTVRNSDEVSKAVKNQTDATYTSDTMKGAMARANDSIAQRGDNAVNDTLAELDTKRGTASRDTLAQAIELAGRYDARGTAADQAMSARLYQLVGEHGSASGQQSQILAQIARRSPAGLRNKALSDLKASGLDVLDANTQKIATLKNQMQALPPGSPEFIKATKQLTKLEVEAKKLNKIREEIQNQVDTISKLPDGPEKDFAVAKMQKYVASQLPQGTLNNIVSVWKAGLLSGSKTSTGGAASNAVFGALKKLSDIPATAADSIIGLATGKVTKTLSNKGIATGTVQGAKNGKRTFETGIDMRNVGDKYEQHADISFKHPVVQKIFGNPSNYVFRTLGALDQPFYYAALKNSLYDQAKAAGMNKGLRGAELKKFMDDTVADPPDNIATTAEREANKAVLSYDTIGSKAIQGVHKGIDHFPGATEAGKNIAHATVNILAPFVRVPSAFISRTIDFTPLGITKEGARQIFKAIENSKARKLGQKVTGPAFDQRALSQAIGEGLTGTGVIALGMALSNADLLSGDYPTDPKEQARWKAEGITPNSVKLGDKWVSLNYAGPVGLLFSAGRNIEKAEGESAGDKAGRAVAGLGSSLTGQSFLQGFSGFSEAIQDPERNLKKFVNSQAGSVVPSWLNDLGNATDTKQRQVDTTGEAVKNRIPFVRESNKPKIDTYGNELSQNNRGLNVANPLRPSKVLTNNVLSEVNRLHSVNENDKDLQVTPTQVDKTISIEGKKVNLTNDQRYDLQKKVGQATNKVWSKLIKTPEYKALSDVDKAKALNNLRTDQTALVQRNYVTDNKLGTYAKNATKSVQALGLGEKDLATYATDTQNGEGTNITIAKNIDKAQKDFLKQYNATDSDTRKKNAYAQNDYEYKAAVAQYANEKAKGTLSKAADIKKREAINKALVGSKFSKDTRELYGLSKDDLYKVVSTDPDGKKIVADVLAYDQALVDAGIIAKSKLKLKNGTVSIKPSTGSGSRSGGGKSSGLGKGNYNLFSGGAAGSSSGSFDKTLRALLENARLS